MRLGDLNQQAVAMEPGRILIVEDSATQRLVLKDMLQSGGHHVIEAKNGAEAQTRITTEEIDAVLMDWELPDASGLDMIRKWKADPVLQWIPVLVFTGYEDPERLSEALSAGAVDFVNKRVNRVVLEARLKTALQLKKLQDELLKLASTDSLTGLLNRRAVMGELRNYAEQGALSVCMLDIDHFKAINDTYGHDVGDAVLASVADLLRSLLPPRSVGRMGGEEFIMLLPNTDASQAQRKAEEVRLAFTTLRWPEHPDLACTVSIGSASSAPDRSADVELLLRTADDALYRAKHAGRNRVEVGALV